MRNEKSQSRQATSEGIKTMNRHEYTACDFCDAPVHLGGLCLDCAADYAADQDAS